LSDDECSQVICVHSLTRIYPGQRSTRGMMS
jgi:hypothetical protein